MPTSELTQYVCVWGGGGKRGGGMEEGLHEFKMALLHFGLSTQRKTAHARALSSPEPAEQLNAMNNSL